MLTSALQYAESHQEQFLDHLCAWLRIPSISTEADRARDAEGNSLEAKDPETEKKAGNYSACGRHRPGTVRGGVLAD